MRFLRYVSDVLLAPNRVHDLENRLKVLEVRIESLEDMRAKEQQPTSFDFLGELPIMGPMACELAGGHDYPPYTVGVPGVCKRCGKEITWEVCNDE